LTGTGVAAKNLKNFCDRPQFVQRCGDFRVSVMANQIDKKQVFPGLTFRGAALDAIETNAATMER
jgi:hypothetical protein